MNDPIAAAFRFFASLVGASAFARTVEPAPHAFVDALAGGAPI